MHCLGFVKRVTTALVVILSSACGGGGDGGTKPPPVPPEIVVTLSALGVALEAGNGTVFTATVTRTNYTSPVVVQVAGAPAGVTSVLTNVGDTWTITLTVATTTAAGVYPLVVRASGTGVASAAATYALTVLAPPAASFALSLAPATLSVQQGTSGQVTVSIARTNFSGPVALAVAGTPAGASATFGSASVTANSTTLTIPVGTGATPATTTLTVTGTAPGIAGQVATLTLTVTAAPPPAGSIALTANPATLTAVAGGAAVTTTITIARTNFSGDVTLTTGPLPNGVTAVFAPVTSQASSSVLTLTFGAVVGAGTYPISVTGTGNGISSASTQLSVTVTTQQQSGVLISAGSVTAQQGASGSTTVIVGRTNFTGAVTLSLSTAPAGVTATFNPSPTTGNTSTAAFAVGAAVTPGTYPLTITASGAGIANSSANINLVVTPAPAGGSMTLVFCGSGAQLPIWVAAQNDTGGWVQLAASASNTYTYNVVTTGAVAWVTQQGADNYFLSVAYGTPAELNNRGNCNTVKPSGRSVTGTVSGFGATNTDVVQVQFGGRSPFPPPTAASPTFTITNVPSGPRDLVAGRYPLTQSLDAARIFLRRGLDPANGASVGTVDFASTTDAFDPARRTATLVGVTPGERPFLAVGWTTNNGSTLPLTTSTAGNATAITYGAVPPQRTAAGDFHVLAASANTIVGARTDATRTVTTVARDPGDVSITLGSPLSQPAVSSTNLGYARLRFALPRQPEYSDFWSAVSTQNNGTASRTTSISILPGYAGNAGTINLDVPDFTGVAGWQNLWGPSLGVEAIWSVQAIGYFIGGGNLIEGASTRTAARNGTFTP